MIRAQMRRRTYNGATIMSRDRQPTLEQRRFLQERILPFLDRFGMERPLVHLLQEAYMQGIKDALQVLDERGHEAIAAVVATMGTPRSENADG